MENTQTSEISSEQKRARENRETMDNVFFYAVVGSIATSILLFGGALAVYHFIMGAGHDASMKPMWVVLAITVAGFAGLIGHRKYRKTKVA